jgi:predicted acyltransferase (DUF342 family)
MYEELLELLEKRFSKGEIDKDNYEELKERYLQKLENAKVNLEEHKEASQIYTSGVKVSTDKSLSVAGSTKITGGHVGKDIRIAGSGKISDDVICNNLKSAGSLKSLGNITAHGDINTAGSFKCEGFLHGDLDAKFSGSAKIGLETIVQGRVVAAGSFSTGGFLQAESGAKFSGSAKIEGNLLSKGLVEAAGRIVVEGDLVGDDVLINKGRDFLGMRFRNLKRSLISGNLLGTGEVYLANTLVEGDVKGLKVEIGPFASVEGTVYYVDYIDVDKRAKLDSEPVKIGHKELRL